MNSFLTILFRVFLSTAMAAVCAVTVVILYTNAQLPPVNVLEDIQLQVPLKILTSDGQLIGEFGEKRRTPISIEEVPDMLKMAILATEDRRFYDHGGIDLRSMARAGLHLMASGTKGQGASTITMQVARNFFLSRKKTFGRKLNEVLLAIKIEQELPKDKILELYLNKIYFGKRAYGVQAAAQVYYGTTVDKLTLGQMAMIAGLPQAPSAINPINDPDAALKRRTHVLNRMLHYNFITQAQYQQANKEPIATNYHSRSLDMEASHVAEMTRKELVAKFGPDVYTSGFTVYTTVDSKLQHIANQAVLTGLLEYDKRHGYRGPIAQLVAPKKGAPPLDSWADALRLYPKSSGLVPAVIVSIDGSSVKAMNAAEQKVTLSFESMRWARRVTPEGLGPEPRSPQNVVSIGDVVYIEPDQQGWRFSQLPEAQSALVAMNPKNGAVLALIGGFDFKRSFFNRATQSTRQPGSNFKPFVYAAALERGYTASTIINDAPIVFHDPHQEEAWRPQNDTKQFYGPTRFRVGLTKSRNLVSIRILQGVGVKRTVKIIEKFGFNRKRLPPTLSLALGTCITSPLEMAMGYSVFANGGFKITPHIIKEIRNSQDQLVYEPTIPVACPECPAAEADQTTKGPEVKEAKEAKADESDNTQKPTDPYGFTAPTTTTSASEAGVNEAPITPPLDPKHPPAPKAIDPQTAYIMTSILQDVIQTGTGRGALALKRSDIAGKTGTTQNQMDAWFTGFNQTLVASVWVGFDEPRSLEEYGSQAALPIWIKFMEKALQGVPETRPEQPRGIVTVRIDPRTGLLAHPGQGNAIFEIFKQGSLPRGTARFAGPDDEDGMYGQPRNRGYYGRDYRGYGRDPRDVRFGRDPRDNRGFGRNPRGGFRRDPNDFPQDMPPPRGNDDSLF